MKAFLATVLLMAAPAVLAQTFSAAPPLAQQASSIVFDWRETPRNQPIAITRAAFDSSGYLLTDENGQLISVPFSGNLYAMQFGKTNGAMYFVNDGDGVPTLYIPDSGYLENIAVSGARWYPFPQRYYYTRPVYLGPAPSWDAYYDMRWYPGMAVYGGYWGYQPWRTGIIYSPMSCLTISLGNRLWNSWDSYCGFWPTATVQPIIIRDTRPVFIDQRDRYDRSRGNGKSYDRPVFREPSRPNFQAPARHSEERAQGQGGADRFNFGNSGGGRSEGVSREREFGRGTQPAPRDLPQTRPGGSAPTFGGGTNPGASREREYTRPTLPTNVPSMAPVRPSGGYNAPSGSPTGSREREFGRTSNPPSGYSVPSMSPVRPNGGNYTPPSSSGSSREREFGRGPSSDPGRTRTFEAPRESRGSSSGSSREGSSSREGQSSRARERGKG